jgi:hypothetical protein
MSRKACKAKAFFSLQILGISEERKWGSVFQGEVTTSAYHKGLEITQSCK